MNNLEKYFENICGLGMIGGLVGFVLGVASCSCSGNSETGLMVFFICVILGGIGGWYIQYSENKEKVDRDQQRIVEQNERETAQFLEQLYNNWDKGLSHYILQIKNNVMERKLDFNYEKAFETCKSYYHNYPKYKNSIGAMVELDYSEKQRYDNRYNELIQWLKRELDAIIIINLTKKTGPYNSSIALLALKTLKIVDNNNSSFDSAIDALTNFVDASYWDTNFLGYIETSDGTVFTGFDKYGKIDFQFDNSDWMRFNDENPENFKQNVKAMITNITNNNTGYYEGISDNLGTEGWGNEILYRSAYLMWYYAQKKPFDINRFNEAKDLYNIYADFSTDNDGTAVKVEVILAIIYYKNQLGGASVVNQDKKYIESWIDSKVKGKWFDSVQILASGLAWMGLYDLERDVLRRLVAAGVSLDADIQERLNFLETGGTEVIPIYDRGDTTDFVYYNSSVDWQQKEFDIFFRQLDMQDKVLDYSLLLNKWTKTLPLRKGQKISNDDIYKELLEMTEDFEGEVKCRKSTAKALDLENLVYENSVIFDFFSNRNRCLSVVFASEKYGRNLNLTILTLFTPEEGLQNDEMKKYALAIQSNIYVESFRESILQALDTVLKEEKTVYDEEATDSKKKNIFE